jgi:hypothetical protein
MAGIKTPGGVVLVLMPVGRDAATVAGLIERTGLRPVICKTLQELVENLDSVVEVGSWQRRRSTAIIFAFWRTGWAVSHRGLINPLSY